MREYRYQVDREGRIFHDGTEIVDPVVLRFFMRAMQRTPDGRFLVVCQGERNWLEAADTPCVVQRVRPAGDRLELVLAGGHVEPLDPSTLTAGDAGLGCRVRGLPARFGRVALQQLAPFLRQTAAGPALALGEHLHPIAVDPVPETASIPERTGAR